MRSAWPIITLILLATAPSWAQQNILQSAYDALNTRARSKTIQSIQNQTWKTIDHVTDFLGWTKPHPHWTNQALFPAEGVRDGSIAYQHPASKKIYIDFHALAQCMLLAQKKSKISASFDSGGELCVRGFTPVSGVQRPTLLEYLSASARECDLASGKEMKLFNWLRGQPDNSVDPVSLYAEAYELNNGNIYKAMLTIHQLLRPLARFYDPARYGLWRYEFPGDPIPHFNDGDITAIMQNKLIDIRGDLKERGTGFKGDHFGTWYRLWGTAMYAGVAAHDQFRPMCGDKTGNFFDQLHQVIGVTMSASLAYLDESLKGAHEADQRKLEIDIAGAGLMSWMQTKLSRKTNEHDCQERGYLRTKPLFVFGK